MSRLFARLTLVHKLLLCSAGFAVPAAVLLYYTVSGFERQIQFAAREIAGANAVRRLCRLAVLLSGPQTNATAGDVDSLLAEIRKAEAELGTLLPPSADADWQVLKSSGANPSAANTIRARLLRDVYAAFPQLAEAAKLILDPELDSYYLSDAVLLRWPALFDSLNLNPDAALDSVRLERVRHAVAVALAEKRSQESGALADRLDASLAAFEMARGSARISAASGLWQTSGEYLLFLLQQRAAMLRRQELTALALAFGGVLLAIGMLVFVLRNLSLPLARATRIAEKIAEGRLGAAEASLSRPVMQKYLTAAATRDGCVRDEAMRLLDAFAVMARSLDSLLKEVRESCSRIEGSTSEITAALRQFEAAVAEQVASTTEVAASSKEIAATVNALARDMRAVTGMAAEAANLASGGLAGLTAINGAMQEMLEGAASVSRILNTISTEAVDINFVLSAITKIANRTNLISLNAAIEAERAGEHAAGFTSVGLEIRRVADHTAVAALDIGKMLGDMQVAVREGVRAMTDYAEGSRANCERVASITADLGRSIEYTRKLEPHFEAVNSGMQMQAEAARQILETMQHLSAVAGQTRSSLAQFREIAEHLNAMVGVLQSEVARFSAA